MHGKSSGRTGRSRTRSVIGSRLISQRFSVISFLYCIRIEERRSRQYLLEMGKSTMIRIGIVGIGFMGRIHYLASQKLSGAKVTAICSRDARKRKGDWTTTRGNFGPEPGHVDLTGI